MKQLEESIKKTFVKIGFKKKHLNQRKNQR